MIKIPHTDNIFEIIPFLTESECLEYILFSEQSGYEIADVQLENSREHLSNIRNNERYDYFSDELASELWKRLDGHLFPLFLGKKAVNLSPHFRFYKYQSGQKFNMHKDGRQKINDNETLFTFLIYLNDNYTGGNTEFRSENLSIQPKVGSALCFEHHEWHQGSVVTSGIKYILRTDVVYC
ncbi:MAG: 2OG-Fe(II) oxygenase [Thalassotalea sp.]